MIDIDEDWSEDESFILINKLKKKKSKLKHFNEYNISNLDIKLNNKLIEKDKINLNENYNILNSELQKEINKEFENISIENNIDKNEFNIETIYNYETNKKFDFDGLFNIFGINSIKYIENKYKNKIYNNKIYNNIKDIKDNNKIIWKFSGVIDSSKSFFIESYNDYEILNLYKKYEYLNNNNNLFKNNLNYDYNINIIDKNENNEDEDILIIEDYEEYNKYINIPILTNKYIPKNCLDLVNDENSIRNILKWIKQWDNFVFKLNNKNKEFNIELDNNNEKYYAPEIPILLVSGPSGCGKSSMIKILSKQCGYEIDEINISDQKTIENFENSIKMKMNYNKIGNNLKRPNLILIDELDSISINNNNKKTECLDLLVKLIDNHSKNRDIVNRPIICICNDIYDKSLRYFRLKAFNIIVKYPPKEKIYKRLSFICRNENIKLEDDEILNELIKIHNNDIRSCLNSIYLMSQKKLYLDENSKKYIIPIYWNDLENCCYTKDIEQDISNFVKMCFGYETKMNKNEVFNYLIEYGEESIINFGSNVIGLLSENIYRCNLTNDFYFDYLKLILDSIVEYNILSSKIYSLLPFLYSSILIFPKFISFYCNQFRYLGSSTYIYSQQVLNSNKNIYKDISTFTIDKLKVDTLTNCFKIYTLPSIIDHFNNSQYSKYFNIWKSTKIIPKLKSLILNSNSKFINSEEFESISLLLKIITKMICYGLKFEDINLNFEQNRKDQKYIKPDIESLYSFQCLNNSINIGYIKNPIIKQDIKLKNHIYDIGFYNLINQLIDFFKQDIIKYINNYNNKNFQNKQDKKEIVSNNKNKNNEIQLLSIPTYEQIISKIENQDLNNKSNYYCIYQYNDGCTDAVKMSVKFSDFYN